MHGERILTKSVYVTAKWVAFFLYCFPLSVSLKLVSSHSLIVLQLSIESIWASLANLSSVSAAEIIMVNYGKAIPKNTAHLQPLNQAVSLAGCWHLYSFTHSFVPLCLFPFLPPTISSSCLFSTWDRYHNLPNSEIFSLVTFFSYIKLLTITHFNLLI